MRRPLAPAFLLAALALSAAPADAGIADLKGTQPGDLTFPDFADADGCANCHGGGYKGDTTYLPSDTWAGTMMANAARDPVFFAALSVANQDKPGVGTYCLRCHSPIGFVQGHATPPDGSAFDAVDKQGVGCQTCHRATQAPAPDAPYYLGDAQLTFTEDTANHGPYPGCLPNDPNPPPDAACSPAHGTTQDTGLSDARFCGQCHQVTNPEVHLRDAQGADTGLEFPLDTTYEEWANSDFGKSGTPGFAGCIDCHMVKKAGMWPVTKLFGAPERLDPREHAFVGGNHWGIEAVMVANPDRATTYAAAFDLAKQRTLDSLAASVKVTLEGAPASLDPGAAFQVSVRVENLTGHKFPTGYAESRRAWIAVGFSDGTGADTVLVGAYDPATGLVQSAPATHVYRAQHGQWDGTAAEAEEHLALHDAIVSDTRIPPKGFQATATTTPTSEIDYGDGQGGYNHFDVATFSLDAPKDAAGPMKLWARVYYQSMTREYVEFLKTANVTDQNGTTLEALYHTTGEAPPILASSAEVTVAFPGGSSSSSSSGAGGAGGIGGGGGNPPKAGGGETGGGGCGCRVAGTEGAASALTALALGASVLVRRRRRSRR